MEEEQGVLLYYRFVTLPDPESTRKWFVELCSSLSLLGRVRISPTGINVTVGGSMESLKLHIKAVESQPLFQGCDFKLAACTHPINSEVAATCGFDSLSVRLVEEIVTLGVNPTPSLDKAGKHLSPKDFHQMLNNGNESNMVVLDARNVYETRIGKFCPPKGVNLLDPNTRQYSDLPAWIDEHTDQLRNKSILMYCTGGVRCEMASAYIRSKGPGFENVFQLSGGIQRYLEAFPEGGYFQGKNFVFDHRVSVASERDETLGHCLVCNSLYDDYTSRSRCSLCRMLVLICDNCKASEPYICELCKRNTPTENSGQPKTKDSKLKILGLHGFRQNASTMKGRLASLSKKLKQIAEFTFVDAPHELPLIYQQNGALDAIPPQARNKKFAWLVDPDYNSQPSDNSWTLAQTAFDPMQYKSQTSGWCESKEYLLKFIAQNGPFDGVLGFSQGASVAAALVSLNEFNELNKFKFVIPCSGFMSPAMGEIWDSRETIQCPSLHIFNGILGNDRQIGSSESEEFANKFSAGLRRIVKHSSGHMVPTGPDYIEQYLAFLNQFI